MWPPSSNPHATHTNTPVFFTEIFNVRPIPETCWIGLVLPWWNRTVWHVHPLIQQEERQRILWWRLFDDFNSTASIIVRRVIYVVDDIRTRMVVVPHVLVALLWGAGAVMVFIVVVSVYIIFRARKISKGFRSRKINEKQPAGHTVERRGEAPRRLEWRWAESNKYQRPVRHE